MGCNTLECLIERLCECLEAGVGEISFPDCQPVSPCPTGEPFPVTVEGFEFSGNLNVSPDGPFAARACINGDPGMIFGQCEDGVASIKGYSVDPANIVAGTPTGDLAWGECPADVVAIDNEFVCNTQTNVWDLVTVVTTNGTSADPVVTAGTISCDEPKPDFETHRECRAGFITVVTNQIDGDGAQTELSAVITPESCSEPVKQTVEVDTCDSTEMAQVDQVVKVEGVVTTKPCPADAVNVDVEFVCNDTTDLWESVVTTVTNGVAAEPVVMTTTIPCGSPQPEFEQVRRCVGGFVNIVTNQIDEDGTVTELSSVATDEPCSCKPSEVWCRRVDTIEVDNHTIGEPRPVGPGFVPSPNWDQEWEVTLSNGQTHSCTFAAWDGTQPFPTPWAYINSMISRCLASVTGKDVKTRANGTEYGVRGGDGDTGTAWGAYGWVDCCPGELSPVQFKTTITSGRLEGTIAYLPVRLIEGEVETFRRCSCCGDDAVWFDDDGNEVDKPDGCLSFGCNFPPAPVMPKEPVDACSLSDTIEVCEISPGSPPSVVTTDLFLQFVSCGTSVTANAFTLDAEGEQVEHNLGGGNYYGNCNTLEPVQPPEPKCSDCIGGESLCYTVTSPAFDVSGQDFSEFSDDGNFTFSGDVGGVSATVQFLPTSPGDFTVANNGGALQVSTVSGQDIGVEVTFGKEVGTSEIGFGGVYGAYEGIKDFTADGVTITPSATGAMYVYNPPDVFGMSSEGGSGGLSISSPATQLGMTAQISSSGDRTITLESLSISCPEVDEVRLASGGCGEYCDAITGVPLTPEQVETLGKCAVEIDDECLPKICEYLGKAEESRKCYERNVRCVDTITVFDNGGSVSASNNIVITPDGDCVIDCLIVRILGTDVIGTPQESGVTVDITLSDGTVITSPVHGEAAGLAVGELDPTINVQYKLPAAEGLSMTAGDSFTIGNIQGVNSTSVGWSNYSNNDNGQAAFDPPVASVFPDVRILGKDIECFFEITQCDGTVRFEDQLGNQLTEIPADAVQVPCKPGGSSASTGPQPTGDCRCYGDEGASSDVYEYENSDNATEGTFSTNTTTIKWQLGGGDGSLDGSIPFINDCINGGNVAVMTITDTGGNVVVFEADSIIQGSAPDAAYSGTGPGGFSGKVSKVTITCAGSQESSGGKACSFLQDDGSIKWIDTSTGAELTAEEIATLRECNAPSECVEICPDCPTETIELVACATEAVAGVGLGDYILTLAERDCNGVIQASTQYNLSDNNTQLTEPVATEACDPAPDVEEIRQCFIDEAGNQWTQVIVIDPSITDPNTTNVIAEFFYDEFLGLGTPVGSPKSWTPCPNPSGLTHVESCICFEYLGEIKKGYAYYYTDGEVQYGEDGDPDNAIVGAAPFCCDDCIQVFGCRDGRLAWPAGSNVTMSNGDVLDIGGLRYTEVAQLIVDNYGGSFLAPSLGGPFGPNFSGCQQSSSHELQFYNLDVAIASIDELEDFGAFGTCQDESLGGSCENPVFVRECPDEPCPDPSIEIYCDSDPAATQYVVVTHASELCGTSGSFIASDYYATPRVLTSYTPVGSPQLCPDSSITEQKCQIDECGTRWSCVTVITPTAGGVVQSETCVPYITLDCSSAQNRQAKTKSIKLSVAEVNTQLAADPPTPVGQLCDCPCPTPVMQTRCTCINGVKVEVEFGIYADSGNYVGWFRRSDTGELLTAEPTWVDCCGECV